MKVDLAVLTEFVSSLYDVSDKNAEAALTLFCSRDGNEFLHIWFETLDSGDLVIAADFTESEDERGEKIEFSRLEFWQIVEKLGEKSYRIRRTILLDGELSNNLDRVRGLLGAEFITD